MMPSQIHLSIRGKHRQPEIVQFSGGELHPKIPPEFKGENVEVMAKIFDAHGLVSLGLILNALTHMKCGVRLTIPYMPYSRQDRVCAEGQAFSLRWLTRAIFKEACLQQIVTWDMHSLDGLNELADGLQGYTVSVSQAEILSRDNIVSKRIKEYGDVVMIQPDKGAASRCDYLYALSLFSGKCVGNKVRDPDSGWITKYDLSGDSVDGKTCFITDDICDGGMTFNLLAKELKSRGARRIILFVTHGIFSKGLDELRENIDEIYCTNSVTRMQDVDGVVYVKRYGEI